MKKFDLTKDEIEILRLYSKGFNIKNILEKLGIKPEDKDFVVKEILNKMNVPTLILAVIVAVSNDLID